MSKRNFLIKPKSGKGRRDQSWGFSSEWLSLLPMEYIPTFKHPLLSVILERVPWPSRNLQGGHSPSLPEEHL